MYEELALSFKVLSDINRLKIIDMLSCSKASNKQMLEYLNITQPTLSHHLKILEENGYVSKIRNGNSFVYLLNECEFKKISKYYMELFTCKNTCRCYKEKNDK